MNVLLRHRGVAVIIWTGSDANDRRVTVADLFRKLRGRPLTYHVAISSFIANTLRRNNFTFTRFAFYPVNETLYQPRARGPSVYFYGQHDYYNSAIVRQHVQPAFPDLKFYYASSSGRWPGFVHYTQSELIQRIYPDCFIGLRLTEHDGLAATVQVVHPWHVV
jgi:hypothetical protein